MLATSEQALSQEEKVMIKCITSPYLDKLFRIIASVKYLISQSIGECPLLVAKISGFSPH